jgi:hypothetical protein
MFTAETPRSQSSDKAFFSRKDAKAQSSEFEEETDTPLLFFPNNLSAFAPWREIVPSPELRVLRALRGKNERAHFERGPQGGCAATKSRRYLSQRRKGAKFGVEIDSYLKLAFTLFGVLCALAGKFPNPEYFAQAAKRKNNALFRTSCASRASW